MDQQSIQDNVDALRDKSRTVDGVPTSLWDVGYRTAGIDGGYSQCVDKETGGACSKPNSPSCTMHDAHATHTTQTPR